MARLDQVTPGEIASLNVVREDLRHLRPWDVLIDQHDPPDTVDAGRERSVGVMMIGCEQQAVNKARLELLIIDLAADLVEVEHSITARPLVSAARSIAAARREKKGLSARE